MLNAKNGNLKINHTDMDYVSFGNGTKHLVMIPGLGDGLKTVKGTAAALAMMYRSFTNSHRVHVFSRINDLETGYSTKDMAADCKAAMEQLGILQADIIGISMGGMIAQYIAIDYPESVGKLVLAVTLARQNPSVQTVIGSWLNMAAENDHKALIIDTTEKSYSPKRLKKYRPLYPILGRIGTPKDFSRFIIQAHACLSHDAYGELHKIICPTMVVGGADDAVVGCGTSEEIAAQIKDCRLMMYEGYGHGVYDEAKDFNGRVLDFLNTQQEADS